MKRIALLLALLLTLFQCNILEEDPLPEPGDPAVIDASHVVMVLSTEKGFINVPGLLSRDVKSSEVELVHQPEFGAISVLDDQYLKYEPSGTKRHYEEKLTLRSTRHPDDEASVTVVVRSDPSEFCLVEAGEPVYLGMPLSYTIQKGDSLEVDLLELFCDYQRAGNGGVYEHDHPELEEEGFEIHLSTQFLNLFFNPPADFTGKGGIIYELCYDLQDSGCLDQEQFFNCPSYPGSCKYFLYTYVEVEVTD